MISLKKSMYFFIFIGIIAFDLLNGFLIAFKIIPVGGVFSPSQLGRLLILVMLLWWMLERRHNILVYLVILVPLLLVECFSAIYHQQIGGFLYGVISALKFSILFVPLLVELESDDAQLMARFYVLGLMAMALVLIVSLLFNIGKPTYGSGGFGTKSFFASGNDIGMYLGGGTLIACVARHYGLIAISWWKLIIIFLGLVSIASKTSLAFLLLSIGVVSLKTHTLKFLIFIAMAVAAYFWETIWSVLSVVMEIIIRRFNDSDGDWLFFITSGRNDFVLQAIDLFLSEYSDMRTLWGRGVYVGFQSYMHVQQTDFLETDVFDIFFMFGLFGLILYVSIWVGYFLKLKKFRWFLLPIVMIFLHSAIAGHVIFSGFCLQLLLALAIFSQLRSEPSNADSCSYSNGELSQGAA